jgi:hypothetical protein
MATVHPSAVLGILEGKFGDFVFAHMPDGKVVVRHRPQRKAKFRRTELHNQSAFTKAAAYVTALRVRPEIYALYEAAARANGKRACNLAFADFYHPPVISDIDLAALQWSTERATTSKSKGPA